MSVHDMKASNENAVQQIEHAGKKAGAEDERKRISELQAAFPTDPAFVTEATGKGWSVTEAKAARFDAVSAHNAELQTKNDELAKAAAAKDPNVEFATSDKEGQKASDDGLGVDEKDRKSAELWNASTQLRANFSGEKGAFQALYRHDHEMALAEVEKAKAKK